MNLGTPLKETKSGWLIRVIPSLLSTSKQESVPLFLDFILLGPNLCG